MITSDRNLLKTFPKNQNKDEPRGWFTESEYATLLVRANELVGTERAIRLAQKGAQVQGNLVCNLKFTADLPKMIELMVNSYIRPTHLKNMRYHHVEIVHNTHSFLRLSLPESKKHDKPIATQAKAVALNEEFYATHSVDGLASEQDYVLMPEFSNRDMALQLRQHQFNELLDDLGFKAGPYGEARTIYSLRHTCIMYALKYHTAEHVTIAKNARTSGEMIERFYANNLTGEMNIAAIQGTQKKKWPLEVSAGWRRRKNSSQNSIEGLPLMHVSESPQDGGVTNTIFSIVKSFTPLQKLPRFG